MASPKFGDTVDPSVGKSTQFPHNDPTKGGRKPSIRKQLQELLAEEGEIVIPANQVIAINNDGSATIKLPTEMQLAMKLKSWAMSKRGADSIKAIQMIMEQIDGKPMQPIDQTINTSESFQSWADKFLIPSSQKSKS